MHHCTPRRFIPFLLALTLLAAGYALAEDSPWQRKLPFQHATISYMISGSESGTETLYIKDYGRQRARKHEGTANAFGVSKKTAHLEITDPDWHYSFNLIAKTGTKSTNPAKFFNEEYNQLSAAEKKNVRKNAEEMGMSMAGDLQGKTVPNATKILGYDCDQSTIMGMTINVIHQTDVPLRSEMKMMGMNTTMEATKIDTGAPPDAAFALPQDITPVQNAQVDALSQQMARDMVSTLKEPDGAEKMKAKFRSGNVGMPAMGADNAGQGSAPSSARHNKRMPVQAMPQEVQDALKGVPGK